MRKLTTTQTRAKKLRAYLSDSSLAAEALCKAFEAREAWFAIPEGSTQAVYAEGTNKLASAALRALNFMGWDMLPDTPTEGPTAAEFRAALLADRRKARAKT